MAERERRLTPPRGGVFVPRTKVLSAEDVQRALRRVAHEIAERNRGLEDVVLVGLQTGGVVFAERIAEVLHEVEETRMPVGNSRRGLLPRRRRDPAGAARGRDGYAGGPHGSDRRLGGRRALHGPYRARSSECAGGLRAGEVCPAGGHGGPWPSRAADPGRLRRARTSRRGSTSRWTSLWKGSSSATWCPNECDHVRSSDPDGRSIFCLWPISTQRRSAGYLRVADAFAEVARRPDPEGPDAPWQDCGDTLRRGVDSDEALLRDRRTSGCLRT